MARSSAPARQFYRAYVEVGNHEKHERESNRTTNRHEWTRIYSIHEAVPLILYIISCISCFSWFKCIISVHSCPFVVQMFYLFVSIRVHSWFKCFIYSCPLVSIRGSNVLFICVHSCPFVVQMFYLFVSIRGSNVLFIRVHSCPFVVQMFYLFVSIRVHSWFKYFRVFRDFVV